jgi:biliverdin reductase / flavin reductase
MRIIVFGASGNVGRLVVAQALERGHDVTAVVRKPAAFNVTHDHLTVKPGQVLDPNSVDEVIPNHDAVISALGVRTLGKTTIFSESGRNILAAMKRHGLTRFVCITTGAVEDEDPAFGLVFKLVIRPTIMRQVIKDCRRLEALLRENEWAQWTAVRPVTLTDDPPTGAFRVSPRFVPASETKDPQIPRADVASFMVDVVESGEWVRATPTIST